MKYLLVFLTFFASQVLAFKPQDIMGGNIKAVGACNQMTCVLVEKNNKQYVIMGELDTDGDLIPLAIYVVENKLLRQIWSILWTDT